MKRKSSPLSQPSEIFDNTTEGINNLQDQAFKLIRQRYELNNQSEITEANITEVNFKNCSKKHQEAFQNAEFEWALLGKIEPIQLNRTEKSRLFIEEKLAFIVDNPKPTFVVSAFVLMMFILPFTTFLKQPNTTIIAEQHLDTSIKNIERYHTGYGYQSEHTLSDGSIVTLNWNTDITVSMTKNQRLITVIKGEANFKVAKDAQRPFIVSVDNVQAKAIGTEFMVKKINDDHSNISVSEGIVAVSTLNFNQASERKTLVKNENIVSENNNLGDINTSNVEEINAWKKGLLLFDNRPLHEALQEINKYTSYDMIIDFKSANNDRVTATFFINSADNALHSLSQLFNLQLKKHKKTMIVSNN